VVIIWLNDQHRLLPDHLSLQQQGVPFNTLR